MKLLIPFVILGIVAIGRSVDPHVPYLITVANHLFTADLYRELLLTNNGSFVTCPLSVHFLMGLVHGGAHGRTAKQLVDALYLPDDRIAIQKRFDEIIEHFHGTHKFSLNSANKIYIKKGFQVRKQYENFINLFLDAEIENIDFEDNEVAAEDINNWVANKTENQITRVVESSSFDEETRALLINAIYFKGQWVKPFVDSFTSEGDFYLDPENTTEVQMMDQITALRYYESRELNAQFLEMPYEGEHITMTIVLPNDHETLPLLEAQIREVLETPDLYMTTFVHVMLPKFKVDTAIQFKAIFQDLGIVDAFEDFADFSEVLVGEPLKISEIVQKTFISIDEDGTTAASETYSLSVAARTRQRRPVDFIANRPFIFYIKLHDVVIFVGKYAGPEL